MTVDVECTNCNDTGVDNSCWCNQCHVCQDVTDDDDDWDWDDE